MSSFLQGHETLQKAKLFEVFDALNPKLNDNNKKVQLAALAVLSEIMRAEVTAIVFAVGSSLM